MRLLATSLMQFHPGTNLVVLGDLNREPALARDLACSMNLTLMTNPQAVGQNWCTREQLVQGRWQRSSIDHVLANVMGTHLRHPWSRSIGDHLPVAVNVRLTS